MRGLQAMYPEIALMASELVGAIGETIAMSDRPLEKNFLVY
ncbi:hypothetical protein [Nostoc sp. FACHB-190]|nr:hypothetical protein [Nostoc sp. FACHB-190]